MDRPGETTHFGFRDVPLGDKQTLVNDVFHSVASRYDLMNDLMSAGLHRVWKDIMINALNPPKNDAPFALLHGAGGTGDIGFRAAEAAGLGFHSTVDVPGLDRLYDFFSFKLIPPLGRAVTGDADSYQYLVESIRKFPRPNQFAEMIRDAGFSRVKWESLSGGIVALHSGWRL